MSKDLGVYKYALIAIGLLCLPMIAFGQDLGSSSGIFNNPKTKTTTVKTPPKKAAPKKAAPKPKAAPAAKRIVPKPIPRTVRTAAKPKIIRTTKTPAKIPTETAVAETPKIVAPEPSSDIVITVGDKSNGDFNELYENSIEEGNAARDAREYTKAESAYLRAQSLQNRDSRAVYGLGNLYSDQQRWEEAERAYRTAMEIEPTAPESYIALSYVLTQPIIGANLAERYSEAEKLARRAIELDPKNAFAYDQLGVALELGGKIGQETQENYRKAIKLEPTFALAYAHLGRLLIKNGLTDQSNAAYIEAIKLAADVPTMILVADVMQSQQKFNESEQLLRRALKEDEKNPTALYLLGRALTVRESYDEAEKILKKSAEVSPKSFISYTLLGSMSVRRGKFADAEKYLLKAVRIVSENEKKRLAQEFEAVGDGYLRAGKNKDAARVLRQAVALDKEKIGLAEKLAKAQVN
jgi:tetratricopeptide (TPR) repeat protein